MLWVLVAAMLPAPWLYCHLAGAHPALLLQVLLPGAAILGASMLLSWGSELAEHDVPQSLALIALALVTVLPEYAVDMYFAWTAGKDPSYVAYATANMTGANRLLIGLGWPAVAWTWWWKSRRGVVHLEKHQALEVFVLMVVTVYCFVIPLKGTLSLLDSFVLLACFGAYFWAAARGAHKEPELEEGPAADLGKLPAPARRAVMAAFFLSSAYFIYISAAPFAEGILAVGRHWGIEEFLLVQWLAPLASEAPEFTVALLYAWRRRPQVGLGALVSSKVNQWTLLVGMLPIAYALSSGRAVAMILDTRQTEEILLTAAQSLFALAVISDFEFSLPESAALGGLFAVQLLLPSTHARYLFSGVYLAGAVAVVSASPRRRDSLAALWRQVLHEARLS